MLGRLLGIQDFYNTKHCKFEMSNIFLQKIQFEECWHYLSSQNLERTVSAFHFFLHIGQQFSRLGRPVMVHHVNSGFIWNNDDFYQDNLLVERGALVQSLLYCPWCPALGCTWESRYLKILSELRLQCQRTRILLSFKAATTSRWTGGRSCPLPGQR